MVPGFLVRRWEGMRQQLDSKQLALIRSDKRDILPMKVKYRVTSDGTLA